MRRVVLLSACLLFVAAAGWWWYASRTTLQQARVTIGSTTFSVSIADTAAERSHGLRGRTTLAPDAGMLFIFPKRQVQVFTMTGMDLSLDFIWIADGAIVGMTENAPLDPRTSTRRYESPAPVDHVLELAAGTVARTGFRVGDRVTVAAE